MDIRIYFHNTKEIWHLLAVFNGFARFRLPLQVHSAEIEVQACLQVVQLELLL